MALASPTLLARKYWCPGSVTMAEDLPFLAEYAKSNRSSCKTCKDTIPKDALRLARMVQVSCMRSPTILVYVSNLVFFCFRIAVQSPHFDGKVFLRRFGSSAQRGLLILTCCTIHINACVGYMCYLIYGCLLDAFAALQQMRSCTCRLRIYTVPVDCHNVVVVIVVVMYGLLQPDLYCIWKESVVNWTKFTIHYFRLEQTPLQKQYA